MARGDTIQGRDLNYTLPPISIRLISLVPGRHDRHSRGAGGARSRRSRAASRAPTCCSTIGTILFGLAGVVAARDAGQHVPPQRRVAPRPRRWRIRRRADLGDVPRASCRRGAAAAAAAAGRRAGRPRAGGGAHCRHAVSSGRASGQTGRLSATVPVDGQLLVNGWLGRGGVAGLGVGDRRRHVPDAESGQQPAETLTRARYGRDREARRQRAGRGARYARLPPRRARATSAAFVADRRS